MSKRKNKNSSKNILTYAITLILMVTCYCFFDVIENEEKALNNIVDTAISNVHAYTLEDIPPYTGQAAITINDNIPFFEESDYTKEAFEKYSELDNQGRCGVAFANICVDIMPKDGEKRESLSSIKTLSGWIQKEYPNIIGTRYLYNRCHLIGWQLSNENANIQNLMTGTAYLNYAMLEYENEVADYIKKNTDYHVLYRVTPIFEGGNKLASRIGNRGSICRK